MIRLKVILACLCLAGSANAATQLGNLTFETAGDLDLIDNNAVDGATRTTNSPYAGTYAIRANSFEPVTNDPITGRPCYNQNAFEINWDTSTTPSALYLRYFRMLDDSTWAPGDGDGNTGFGKGEYMIGTSGGGTELIYTGLATDGFRVGNQTLDSDWVTNNWGTAVLYFEETVSGEVSLETDGTYRMFEFYFDYTNGNFYMWYEGNPVKLTSGGSSLPALWGTQEMPYPDGYEVEGWGFMYSADSQIVNSTDGTGYATANQFDNIEWWDGCPSAAYSCADVVAVGSGGTATVQPTGPITIQGPLTIQ